MRVLLTGASGFLGRHLAAALPLQGHTVVCAFRAPRNQFRDGCAGMVEADFTRDHRFETWLPRLRGVDAVINAVGILREQGAQTFESLHVRAPRALFDACTQANVQRVIQISALGADEHARSGYHISKRRAEEHLSALPLAWTIVQPSLVYGPGGTSARLFDTLASLPLIPLPRGGRQLVQPIHIDDFVDGMIRLLVDEKTIRQRVAFVGPAPISLRDYLTELRSQLGLGTARIVAIPLWLVRASAAIGALLPGSLLDRESLAMLERGNTADARPLAAILEREPRPVMQFISTSERESARRDALLGWILPMLRVSIALVWIGTAIVSFGLYPTASSYALLARVGVPEMLAPLFLYGAATLDLVLGIATLVMRRRRALWLAQIALILGYTALITWRLPEFWLHPYGPLLKNVPMLAVLFALYVLEKRR